MSIQRYGILRKGEFISNNHSFPGCKPVEYEVIPPDYDPYKHNLCYLTPVDYGGYLFVPIEIKSKELCEIKLEINEELLPF